MIKPSKFHPKKAGSGPYFKTLNEYDWSAYFRVGGRMRIAQLTQVQLGDTAALLVLIATLASSQYQFLLKKILSR